MELERPRKMELLHTPKSEVLRLMRENSVTMDEVVFLFGSNKVAAADIRMNAPTICDKMLAIFLSQMAKRATVAPMTA
jgi:hypothetical protein